MTPKQTKFAQEYLLDMNGKQAAIRAGYAPGSAEVTASRLLRDDNVAAAIETALAERSARTGITSDRVLQEYARIAFADLRNVVAFGPEGVRIKDAAELSEDDAAVIAEVTETVTEAGGTKRVKLHDKVRALDALAKHLGLMRERVDHAVRVEIVRIGEDEIEDAA